MSNRFQPPRRPRATGFAVLDTPGCRVRAHTTPFGRGPWVTVGVTVLAWRPDQAREALLPGLRRVLSHFFPARWSLLLRARWRETPVCEGLHYLAYTELKTPAPPDLVRRAALASSELALLTRPQISLTLPLTGSLRELEALSAALATPVLAGSSATTENPAGSGAPRHRTTVH